MYDKEQALKLLKIRLNRLQSNNDIDDYLKVRLAAADRKLQKKGINLSMDNTSDLMLLVDYTAWEYQNRDKPGSEPEWLRIALRERWLAERGLL